MASHTVENYLKQIFRLAREASASREDAPVATGVLATAMGVSPGTVTSMLKTLAEGGLATYTPYEGVRLTDAGEKLALRILRRHRLIELFLSRTLDLTWDEVHEEAEHMEHAVSDLLVDRIDQYLDFPESDPHGEPIPTAAGAMAEVADRPLASLAAGDAFCFRRVTDETPDFLRRLSEAGIELGRYAAVVSSDAEGEVTIRLGESTTKLSAEDAEKLRVE
ncbi:Iron-dependent repressor IdeR [Pseudobythopirellula maris]|uniref:Transcriptional regulator MntR n=1 Tax=Pseudobythopirellula maris TaxID=2527991 RepID=A0A5C5ZPG0_9BACT|nr:metal-dependent transcriptional regulator [Pseudobythopirellula maris]TWT88273.1 Iron-dependent repressor IdeR [Pseudobythopirellula maris]